MTVSTAHFLAIFATLALSGCASRPFRVTLSHAGGFSGTTETFFIDQSGHAEHDGHFPGDSITSHRTNLGGPVLTRIRDLLYDRGRELDTIRLSGKGNLTTGITIESDSVHNRMTWPNLDPPPLGTPALDSLYHLMLQVEAQLTVQPTHE